MPAATKQKATLKSAVNKLSAAARKKTTRRQPRAKTAPRRNAATAVKRNTASEAQQRRRERERRQANRQQGTLSKEKAKLRRDKERARIKDAKAKAAAKSAALKAKAKQAEAVQKEREAAKIKRAADSTARRQERAARRAAEALEKQRAKAAAVCWCTGCGEAIAVTGPVSSNGPRRRVSCAQCSRPYHASCLRPAVFVGASQQVEAGSSAAASQSPKPCLLCLSGRYPTDADAAVGSATPSAAASLQFFRDGYVVVPLASSSGGVTPATDTEASRQSLLQSRIADAKAVMDGVYRRLLQAYEMLLNGGESVPTLETGYANFRERGRGRFELVDKSVIEPIIEALLPSDSPVRAVLDHVLPPLGHATDGASSDQPQGGANDVVMFSNGCIYATPGSDGQNWHTDGPSVSVLDDNALPYAVNVFIPLIDVTPINGTRFVPASHRPSTMRVRAGGAADVQAPVTGANSAAEIASAAAMRVTPSVSTGNALMFDYRVVHRGLPNQGSAARPLLYCTFARRWYAGDENFNRNRYRGTLKPATPSRRRG
jgi:hypothetical protein